MAELTRRNDDDVKSKRVTLADLSAKGTALYAHKKYDEAAEVLSRASDLQAKLNGDLHADNGEILFHYGHSLFKAGQRQSEVLGGAAAAVDARASSTAPVAAAEGALDESAAAVAAHQAQQLAKDSEPEPGDKAAGCSDAATSKPLFQFSGDDNLVAEEEPKGPDDDDEQEEDDDDDDLSNAFEILDLARLCFHRKLEGLPAPDRGEGPLPDSAAVRHIKERLADTHDCLAEISLEGERYPAAIDECRTSLAYKMELYPNGSEIIAEAHYKLSLALEFASIILSNDDGSVTKRDQIDQELRNEAIEEMELAIESFKLNMQGKEVELATMASPEDNDVVRAAISEMKDVISEMEQKLADLHKNPIDDDAIRGILGSALGSALGQAPSAEAQARADEAAKHAKDLTSMVRKRGKDAATATRRKADEPPAAGFSSAEDSAPPSPKKPRLDDAGDDDKA